MPSLTNPFIDTISGSSSPLIRVDRSYQPPQNKTRLAYKINTFDIRPKKYQDKNDKTAPSSGAMAPPYKKLAYNSAIFINYFLLNILYMNSLV